MKKRNQFVKNIVLVILCILLAGTMVFFYIWDRSDEKKLLASYENVGVSQQVDMSSFGDGTGEEATSEEAAATEDTAAAPEATVTYAQAVSVWGDQFFDSDSTSSSYVSLLADKLANDGHSQTVEDHTVSGTNTLSVMDLAGIESDTLDAYITNHQSGNKNLSNAESAYTEHSDEEKARSDQEDIPVIFMGYYGGWNNDTNELVQQIQFVINTFGTYKDQAIVVGMAPQSGNVTQDAIDEALGNVWGDHYISVADVCSSDFFTFDGQEELADAIYQKLVSFGYLG